MRYLPKFEKERVLGEAPDGTFLAASAGRWRRRFAGWDRAVKTQPLALIVVEC
jgi:hypothetical protein